LPASSRVTTVDGRIQVKPFKRWWCAAQPKRKGEGEHPPASLSTETIQGSRRAVVARADAVAAIFISSKPGGDARASGSGRPGGALG
jgi:hypothetical protein